MRRPARGHVRLAVFVLVLSSASFSMMQTVVSPIIHTIQLQLHTTQNTVTWVMTAYLLSAAVCTPIIGRVGDMYGKDRVFVLVLVIFGLGGVLSALAPNIATMIIARLIQGVGGAVVPLGFGIVRDIVARARVISAVGLIAGVVGAGGGLALVLTGPIVNLLGYRWVFWLPVIVIAICAVLAYLVIPPSPARPRPRVNWWAGTLLAIWLVALLLGISQAPEWGWVSPKVLGLLAGAIIVLVVWVVTESRSEYPVIDIKMLRRPTVWRVNLVAMLYGAALFSAFTFLPQYVQAPTSTGYGYGTSVTESGVILLPSAALTFVFGALAAALVRRIGSKNVVVIGSGLIAISFAIIALPGHHLSWLFIATAAQGIGYGISITTIANLIVAAVPADQTSVANGMNTNLRVIGGAIGSAVVSSLVTSHLQASGYPTASSYAICWVVLAGIGALATGVAFSIGPSRPTGGPQLIHDQAVRGGPDALAVSSVGARESTV